MEYPASEIHVNGIVQGVGFRPFVYRLAVQLGLKGHVGNTGEGVVIKAAGPEVKIESFLVALRQEAPPLARITSLEHHPAMLPKNTTGFTILDSEPGAQNTTQVSPDTTICADCLREISDPDDRRSGYPFTNCTNCGPRYTIILSLPYDRPGTTMKPFQMCPACQTEYTNPLDRRFHAQPNGCAACGPRLTWHDGREPHPEIDKPLTQAAQELSRGAVVGIKGLGGFHLAVNAYSTDSVKTLRQRKQRPAKPLAVMVRDQKTARDLCLITPEEESILCSFASPIVVLKKRTDTALTELLAPNLDKIGVMLPYTPLHCLLFAQAEAPDCLVMTSGNAAGSPLCKDNDEALDHLGSFCDGFLIHDRDIHTRVDDSVVRVIAGKPSLLRRSRGYAPASVRLARESLPLLAVGGELKNSFCLVRGRDAFMSQYIGNMNTMATFDFFKQTLTRLQTLLKIEPQLVTADLHPDYLSTRFAEQLDLPLVRVQHHWAHGASVMAEHGLNEALAIILDGTGFGPDGTVWGGEILQCSYQGFKRLGRLTPLPMPGGDQASRQPWRMALAALHGAGIQDREARINLENIPEREQSFIRQMMTNSINSPLTSSCGRLFDAVASLLGVCQINTYEGQAAMELESWASKALGGATMADTPVFQKMRSEPLFKEPGGLLEGSTDQCIQYIVQKMLGSTESPKEIALFFHVFLVCCFGNMIRLLSKRSGIDNIVLSGGCMQNRILVEGFFDFFAQSHLKVFTNVQVPANDGGIALGQAAIGGS